MTLVLGMTTSLAMLTQMLPAAATDLLHLQPIPLVQVLALPARSRPLIRLWRLCKTVFFLPIKESMHTFILKKQLRSCRGPCIKAWQPGKWRVTADAEVAHATLP